MKAGIFQLTYFIIKLMQNILALDKRAEFDKLVHITNNINEKDHHRAILNYNEGNYVWDIENILKTSNSTTYNYINDYLGQCKITHTPCGGSNSKLTVRKKEN